MGCGASVQQSKQAECEGTEQSKCKDDSFPSQAGAYFVYEHQRWWAVHGWLPADRKSAFGYFDDPPAWTSLKLEAVDPPATSGAASFYVVVDDGTDDQGWIYSGDFTDIKSTREGGHGRLRATDCVARRLWVSPGGHSALTARAKACHPEQLLALKNSQEEEMKAALSDTVGIFVKMLKAHPVGALLATSVIAWVRLQRLHQARYEDLKRELSDPLDAQDQARLKGCLYALPYTKAVYGYPMLQGHMDTVGTMTMAALQRLKTPGFDPLVSPDTATNIAAMLSICGRSEDDLLHVHFDATPLRPAHAVFVDHSASAVVLAIRGTLSVEDAMTDAMASEVDDADMGRKGGGFHVGILRAAKWVAEMSKAALEKACADFPSYRLVITGHSLGAGTAAILTLLLDANRATDVDATAASDDIKSVSAEVPGLAFKRIEGYTFACPGVVSADVAESPRALSCITSIACRKDVIVRLCLRSIDVLVHELSSKSLLGTVARHVKECSLTARDGGADQGPTSDWPQHRTVGNCYWIPDPTQADIRKAAAHIFDQILVSESMLPDHLVSRYESGLVSACKFLGLTPGLPVHVEK